ncbi:MAG: hypothetical protein KBT13_02320 [Bacteroidales bacterium]|nr:hypothetical protein [Candidatus Sodaliphilus limicaballi]
MKKILLASLSLIAVSSAWAGGLLSNTNQHIAFNRMMARGASTEIDAVYSNPAGTAFNEHEGLTLSLNIQSAFQTRNVDATFPLFLTEGNTKRYEGNAAAPVLPSLFAMYKKDKWVFQAGFGVTGGGGKCSFDDGLPMFEAPIMAGLAQMKITPDKYAITSSMKGRQYVFGLQAGASYKFNEHFAGHLGARVNYFNGNYTGFVKSDVKTSPIGNINVELDCNQTGWGVTPIIGLDYKVGRLTLASKFEYKTKLNIENDTKKNDASVSPIAEVEPAITYAKALEANVKQSLTPYNHGVNTPNDLPSVLYVAAGYEILPEKLRATVEYHFYDDKHAGMAGDKQKSLTRGTNEYLAGVEWDINKMFTVSTGTQITSYGLSDDYQSQTSFSCNSYSIGLGGAVNLTSKLKLNVAYFWTTYKDYTKSVEAGNPGGYCGSTLAGKDVYSRTNKVFGVGLDYKF